MRLYALLAALDVLMVVLAFVLANEIRFGEPFDQAGLIVTALILPSYFVIAFSHGAYSAAVLGDWQIGLRRVTIAFALSVVIVMLIDFFVRTEPGFSRLTFSIGVLVALGLLAAMRFVFGRYAETVLQGTPFTEMVIVDGVAFPAMPNLHLIDSAAIRLQPDPQDPEMIALIGTCLNGVDRVLIACPPERRMQWSIMLKGSNVNGWIVAPELDALGALHQARFRGCSAIPVSSGPLNLRYRALKRTMDLALTVPALILFGPLLMVIAVAVKLDSPGPVFFRQKRLGRGNRMFDIYKFRSMRVETSDADGNRSAARDDDRITRVGSILRRTSLDELPQLLNVLDGSMSLVGPRPHALGSLAGSELFWQIDERYWHRHASKPGITGLAQVRGFRGATAEREDLVNRLQADLEYQDGWSVWRDLRIIVATLGVVIHKNAF